MKHPTATRRWLLAFRSLTVASIKMYVRNLSGLFFSLFIPIALIVIFGLLFQNNNFKTKISLTNHSDTELSKKFVESLKGIEAFDIEESDEQSAAFKLGRGKVDLQIVMPADFGTADDTTRQLKTVTVQTYFNEARPQQGQTTNLVVAQVVSGFNQGVTKAPTIIAFNSTGVKTNNLGQLDFLLPGILAMSIMQLGIFSVAFGFIAYKTSGALRRLQATPVHPFSFVVAQGVTRVMLSMIQVALLLGLGVAFFNVKFAGDIISLMIMVFLGSVVFLGFGFAIAGWARDEMQAAPVAQLIQFPMLFLSGIFFPREGLPEWLQHVTAFFPLTYLADGMRKIATEGATIFQVGHEVLGLTVWGIIVYFIAVRVFRWE